METGEGKQLETSQEESQLEQHAAHQSQSVPPSRETETEGLQLDEGAPLGLRREPSGEESGDRQSLAGGLASELASDELGAKVLAEGPASAASNRAAGREHQRRASAETAAQYGASCKVELAAGSLAAQRDRDRDREQRQMFSLKQLARQSRPFAKPKPKRANSIQVEQSISSSSRAREQSSNSASSSNQWPAPNGPSDRDSSSGAELSPGVGAKSKSKLEPVEAKLSGDASLGRKQKGAPSSAGLRLSRTTSAQLDESPLVASVGKLGGLGRRAQLEQSRKGRSSSGGESVELAVGAVGGRPLASNCASGRREEPTRETDGWRDAAGSLWSSSGRDSSSSGSSGSLWSRANSESSTSEDGGQTREGSTVCGDSQPADMRPELFGKERARRRGRRAGKCQQHAACGPAGPVTWRPLVVAAANQRQERAEKGQQQEQVGGPNLGTSKSLTGTNYQQVTDVDLITYKHLCQLETNSCSQCFQQMVSANLRAVGKSTASSHYCRCCTISGDSWRESPKARPSSQEEHQQENSKPTGNKRHRKRAGNGLNRLEVAETKGQGQPLECPYYELCVSREEQLIRRKYAWFPPSLKTLQLVDQFFSYFPPDKIPYNRTFEGRPLADEDKAPTGQGKREAAEVASEQPSYRDKQVEVQLPKQDISLHYCSYKLNEQGRTSYEQFVDKRNSQALDVGLVVEFGSGQNGENQLGGGNQQQDSANKTTPDRLSCQHNQQEPMASRPPSSRKGSLVGQSSLVAPTSQPQRCRRCLVRFEPGQLVVVAPNFMIGAPNVPMAGGQQQAGQLQSALAASLYQVAGQLAASTAASQSKQAPIVDTQLHRRASTVSMTIQPSVGQPLGSRAGQLASSSSCTPMGADKFGATSMGGGHNCAMFHPQCFACSTCKEFLVDLVYCLRDNKLYCMRHYGDSVRPRCSWCQEVSVI